MIQTEKETYEFQTVEGLIIDDVVNYISKVTLHVPDTTIYVGVDSKVKKKSTFFALVIGIRYPGRGVHIIYAKKHGKKFHKADVEQRLWKELEYAVDLGLYLDKRISKPIQVHIDISPHSKDRSHKLFNAAIGWMKGVGLDYRAKPESWAAMRAADFFTYADRY